MFSSDLLKDLDINVASRFEVRPLKLSDYDAGYLPLLSQLTSVGDVSEEAFKKRFLSMAETSPQAYYIIVAEDSESKKVVAAVTLVIEWKFIHEAGSRARIEDVVVDEKCRGSGLAKVLLKAATQLGKKLNAYKVSLECSDGLLGFYEKFGYKKKDNFMVIRFD